MRLRIPLRGPWALIAGAVCIGIAVYQGLVSGTLITRGIAAEAVVVERDSRRSGTHGRSYSLTLEFRDLGGSVRRELTGYSKLNRRHRVGDSVAILYNPNDPREFAIDGWYELWAWPLGFGALGAIGCAAFLSGRGRRDRAPLASS